jgi:hypothetical protein
LTHERGDHHQIEHSRECIGVARDIVDVRGTGQQHLLRFPPLNQVRVILLQRVAGGREQADVSVGERAGQFVELGGHDRLT